MDDLQLTPNLAGFRLVENPVLMVVKETKAVRRTWRERLFSLPWRPLRPTRLAVIMGPDPNLYHGGRGVIVGHPATIRALVEAINQQPMGAGTNGHHLH